MRLLLPLPCTWAGARLLVEVRRTRPVIVADRLDRLFRSVADGALTIAHFDLFGMELEVVGILRPHLTVS